MDTNIITIQDLLLWGDKNQEFTNEANENGKQRIKLIRHLDNRDVKVIAGKEYDSSLYLLYRDYNDLFLTYQNEQKTANFVNVEYIVSFIGEENRSARFVGVYKNCGHVETGEERSVFDFQKVPGFEKLEERVIIDWGDNAISWHQWWKNAKYVTRIDRGMSDGDIPVFTSYEDVMLNYRQLRAIFDKNNLEWKYRLEACNCIYMILDKSNGKQYVGSTYTNDKKSGGGKGIWKRWAEYAETGHGGNKSLEDCCMKDPNYHINNFQWCILETLPLNVTGLVAIDREAFYKRKFGTMEPNGYNNN